MTNLRAVWSSSNRFGPILYRKLDRPDLWMPNLRADWASSNRFGPILYRKLDRPDLWMPNPRADWVSLDVFGPILYHKLDPQDFGKLYQCSDCLFSDFGKPIEIPKWTFRFVIWHITNNASRKNPRGALF